MRRSEKITRREYDMPPVWSRSDMDRIGNVLNLCVCGVAFFKKKYKILLMLEKDRVFLYY